jgi:hypothetical protein
MRLPGMYISSVRYGPRERRLHRWTDRTRAKKSGHAGYLHGRFCFDAAIQSCWTG